jgi:hypothetical protein
MPRTDLETLMVSVEASLTKFNRSMSTLGPTTNDNMRKVKKPVDDTMAAIEKRTADAAANMNKSLNSVGGKSSAFGRSLQNVGYQVGDLAVQVGGGTDFFRALGQQLPQLIQGFGVWGSLAGAAVSVTAALAGSIFNLGGKSKEAEANYKSFLETASSTKEIVEGASQGLATLQIKLNQADETTRRAFAAQLQKQIYQNSDELKEAATGAQDTIVKSLDIIDQMFGKLADETKYTEVLKQFNALNEAIKAVPTDPARWHALSDFFKELANSAPDEETARKLREFAGFMDDNADKARNVANQTRVLTQQLQLVTGAASGAATAVSGMGDASATATGQVSGLAGQVKYLAEQYGRLSTEQKTFAPEKDITRGFIRPGAGQITGALPGSGPGSVPNIFIQPGQEFDVDEASQAFNDAEDKFNPNKGKKKSGAKATPETRGDRSLQQIRDEIAMNKQLVAQLGLTDAEVRKVKASYEAIRLVRQAGFKEGDKEYEQYLKTAQGLTAENAALEHRIELYRQGKSLTEGLMTDQERQTKQLADYKEMLDAGAITQDTYERAVRRAKEQNNQLTEAIQGVGEALTDGIQQANSFGDALAKIGLNLLSLAAKGLFGQGPLGGLFNSLFNVAAGGILGQALPAGTGATSGIGGGYTFAGGGDAGPGVIRVGENGPELLSLSRRSYVTPANAVRRSDAAAARANGPMTVNVIGARGNREIEAMVAAGVSQAVRTAGHQVPSINRSYQLRFG